MGKFGRVRCLTRGGEKPELLKWRLVGMTTEALEVEELMALARQKSDQARSQLFEVMGISSWSEAPSSACRNAPSWSTSWKN